MGSIANRLRKNWQTNGGQKAKKAEDNFKNYFDECLKDASLDETYKISSSDEFSSIYVNQHLDEDDLNNIYKPENEIKKHGVNPDFKIENKKTGKKIFIEVKRQDGWVEGKKRSAGRGNAHERLCKYFTPGLIEELRKSSGINNNENLPFLAVFQGDITRDPCRVREIRYWFKGYNDHVYFWRKNEDKYKFFEFFEEKIKPLID